MASFNKVILVGNLTRDPEQRSTPSGKAVADITLAINEFRGKGETGSENTTFVDVTLWERTAEVVCQYLHKGSPLLVEGRLSQDKWQDKETGKNMSKLRVVANNVQMLGSKGDNESGVSSAPRSSAPRQSRPAPTHDDNYDDHANSSAAGDDDIPF